MAYGFQYVPRADHARPDPTKQAHRTGPLARAIRARIERETAARDEVTRERIENRARIEVDEEPHDINTCLDPLCVECYSARVWEMWDWDYLNPHENRAK